MHTNINVNNVDEDEEDFNFKGGQDFSSRNFGEQN